MKYLDKDGLSYLWGKIKSAIPTKTSQLTNDSGFLTSHLTGGRSIYIYNNQINNTGVTNVSASPSSASNGTIAVTKGTEVGTSTTYVTVKGINNGAYKDVDTSISAGTTSTKLPTSSAVASFVEGKGYITGITSSDVTTALGYTPYNSTNPNGYTSNTGTITGITMNGASKGTSGVVDLGTVITSHQTLKTVNNTSLTGTGNVNTYGHILWTNSSPTSQFGSQNITLSDSDFDMYEIIFKQSNTDNRTFSSGLIMASSGTILNFNTTTLYWRVVSATSKTVLNFDNGKTGSNNNNASVIPLYVIGHNTGLFS